MGTAQTYVILLITGVIITTVFVVSNNFCKNEERKHRCEKTVCTKDGCIIWDDTLNRCGLDRALSEERKRKQIEDKKELVIDSLKKCIGQKEKELELTNDELRTIRAKITEEMEKSQKCKAELDSFLKIKDSCKADSLASKV